MKIDAHLHVNFEGLTTSRLMKYLDSHKIDYCWLLTWEEVESGKWSYQNLSVEDVLECYVRNPERVIPFYAPDPRREDAVSTFSNYQKQGFKGCGELKVTLEWTSPNVRNFLDNLQGTGAPVLFHMQESSQILAPIVDSSLLDTALVKLVRTSRLRGLQKRLVDLLAKHYQKVSEWMSKRTFDFPGYMLDMAKLELTLQDYPTVNFVGHGPLFWKHIQDGETVRLLHSYPNLYADISAESGFNALKRDRIFSQQFLDCLSHKIVFGTDNSRLGHENLINSLGLAKSVRNRIMGDNAASLLPCP